MFELKSTKVYSLFYKLMVFPSQFPSSQYY